MESINDSAIQLHLLMLMATRYFTVDEAVDYCIKEKTFRCEQGVIIQIGFILKKKM
jgi:hypothetical protein